MKYQVNLQEEIVTLSPEIRAAYNEYRLTFYRLAVKELDAQDNRNTQVITKDDQDN